MTTKAKGTKARTGDSIILPGGGVTIKETAEELFKRIGPTKTMFIRGGAVTVIVDEKGTSDMGVLEPAAARSRFESYAEFLAWRIGRNHEPVLKPAIIPQEMSTALLESEEARTFLPSIAGLINCPVIVASDREIQIIGRGYHGETGVFVTGGELPPTMDLYEALLSLNELVEEFDFQTPSDRSRALASFISPALKLGGHLRGNVPADVAEADKSQSGKTYRQRLGAAVYNEKASLVTCRNGGVGSLDESLNARLIAGHPFIQLDNFRGKLDSPHIEALLTAEKSFPARVPHCREVMIDPSRFFIMLSSNGVETTRDFANRGSIVRNRKREGYKFRSYPEGDLLAHVWANQPRFLGAVFAIVREWIDQGCPHTDENRHDFREWAQTLDWIVQNILGEAPLMDGHQAAQERVSNPDLTFARNLALAVANQDRLRESLVASDLSEIAEAAQIGIPGLREPDADKGTRQIGTIMARLFKAGDSLTLDEFAVTRCYGETARSSGGTYPAKTYRFERGAR